jgi:hypothetical protein
MTYLVWRQYRLQWAIALVLLAAFAAIELINGLQVAHAWHSLLTTCAAAPASSGGPCLQRTIVSNIGNYLRLLSEIVPALLGIFWGAPLVAQELESGTTRFAWTQGITRNRWLWVKVGWLLLAAAVWGGAVSALVTWWSGPVNAQQAGAFLPNNFDTQGIVPIGYAVFAMALGITAGALFRHTLPAIAATIAVFIPVRLWVTEGLRQHLMPAVTTLVSPTSNWSPPGIAWTIGTAMVGKNGQVLAGNSNGFVFNGVPVSDFPAACQKIFNSPTAGLNSGSACLAKAGFHESITYQPGYHYWPIQGVETGLYLLAAAVLLLIAWYAIRRRDA